MADFKRATSKAARKSAGLVHRHEHEHEHKRQHEHEHEHWHQHWHEHRHEHRHWHEHEREEVEVCYPSTSLSGCPDEMAADCQADLTK